MYVVVLHVDDNVLKWYPMLSFSNHLKSDSRNIINRYGLKVSPCMVPQLISIGGVIPKSFPVKDVVKFWYIFSTISTASRGKSRSSMRANGLAWLMKPKAF